MPQQTDPTPRTFREVGMTFAWIRTELEDIRDSIDAIHKGQNRLIALILTTLIAPVISGIVLAVILGTKK